MRRSFHGTAHPDCKGVHRGSCRELHTGSCKVLDMRFTSFEPTLRCFGAALLHSSQAEDTDRFSLSYAQELDRPHLAISLSCIGATSRVRVTQFVTSLWPSLPIMLQCTRMSKRSVSIQFRAVYMMPERPVPQKGPVQL